MMCQFPGPDHDIDTSALARLFSWLEHHPMHQKSVGSIPGQVTYLSGRFDPWSRHIWEVINQCFSPTSMSLSLSLSLSLSPSPFLPPSLSQINKHIIGWRFKKLTPLLCLLDVHFMLETQLPCHKEAQASCGEAYHGKDLSSLVHSPSQALIWQPAPSYQTC